jgi:hypothetical protein
VEMTPYDDKKGRIVYRGKWKLDHQLRKFVRIVKLFVEREESMLFVKTQNINKDKVNYAKNSRG